MIIIPAVDIKDGKCVRLLQGRIEDETVYSEDPAAMAHKWAEAGAELIHVIDLDGAFARRPQNIDAIRKILKHVDVPLQLGGGIRSRDTIQRLLDMGVQRVIIGTEAIENPNLIKEACYEFPNQIVLGLDARDGYVAIEGWTHTTGIKAIDLAKQFEDCGLAAINFTDIHRDGMQTGPNVKEIQNLAETIAIPVVASGGVSTIKDIHNLLPLTVIGVVGVIVGKALYTGSLNLKEAIDLAKTKPGVAR
jgi:phosphoribosylformimino-5-aminoimidazole carboxamide ribotide isomerase